MYLFHSIRLHNCYYVYQTLKKTKWSKYQLAKNIYDYLFYKFEVSRHFLTELEWTRSHQKLLQVSSPKKIKFWITKLDYFVFKLVNKYMCFLDLSTCKKEVFQTIHFFASIFASHNHRYHITHNFTWWIQRNKSSYPKDSYSTLEFLFSASDPSRMFSLNSHELNSCGHPSHLTRYSVEPKVIY